MIHSTLDLQKINMSIRSLDDALLTVKAGSRDRYKTIWKEFLSFCPTSHEFENRLPTEDEFTAYFKHLREVKKMASSSMWTYYSMINSCVKGIYSDKLQNFPRITSLLKAYDTDTKSKAHCFEGEDIAAFTEHPDASTPYWLVRKVVIIVAYFGGLRYIETASLQLERVSVEQEGVFITHSRAKQRSDKTETRFLIPRNEHGCNYAAVVENYLAAIKQECRKRFC